MGIKQKTYFIAKCDICDNEFESSDGGIQCFNSKKEIKEIVVGCDWTIKNGKLKCPDCIEQP